MNFASCIDELEKISARKGEYFSAALAAHELGHAKDLESSMSPKGRMILRSVGRLGGGLVGGLAGASSGSALLGGSIAALGNVPLAIDESLASYHGMQALKESGKLSEKDMKAARNQLLLAGSSYLALAAGSIAAGAGASRPGAAGVLLSLAGTVGGIAGASLLSKATGRSLKDTKAVLSRKDVDALQKQMGVKARVYAGTNMRGVDEDMKRIGAQYLLAKKDRLIPSFPMFGTSRKNFKRINQEGGAVIPLADVR